MHQGYKLKESLVLHHHIVYAPDTWGKPSYTTILCDAPGTNLRKAQLHHHIVWCTRATNLRKAQLHHHIVWCTRYKLEESPATPPYCLMHQGYKLKESPATPPYCGCTRYKLKESPATPPYCVMHQIQTQGKPGATPILWWCFPWGKPSYTTILCDAPGTNSRKAELHHHIVWCTRYKLKESRATPPYCVMHQVQTQGKPSYTTILCDAPGTNSRKAQLHHHIVWCTRYKLKESRATPPYCVMHQVQT